MKIFISWSGECKEVAKELKQWFSVYMHDVVEAWMSDESIQPGDRWNEVISKHLEESHFGILCITEKSKNAPWVLFEAGAIAKSVKARVVPYLINMSRANFDVAPLKQFQASEADMIGTWELINKVNNDLLDNKIPSERLKEQFDRFWPGMEQRITELDTPGPVPPPIPSDVSDIDMLTKEFVNKGKNFLGDYSIELAGLFTDSLRNIRMKRCIELFEKSEAYLQEWRIEKREPIPLKIMMKILEYASLEDDEEIFEKWVGMLTSGAYGITISSDFPLILSRMNKSDFLILENMQFYGYGEDLRQVSIITGREYQLGIEVVFTQEIHARLAEVNNWEIGTLDRQNFITLGNHPVSDLIKRFYEKMKEYRIVDIDYNSRNEQGTLILSDLGLIFIKVYRGPRRKMIDE